MAKSLHAYLERFYESPQHAVDRCCWPPPAGDGAIHVDRRQRRQATLRPPAAAQCAGKAHPQGARQAAVQSQCRTGTGRRSARQQGRPTLAERNADFNKRKAEAAEAKQAAANAQRKADEAANCNAARQNQQALDQGLRLSTYDKNGERGYMNDEQREELRKNTQKVLADCK
jgi:hypothetical protein